MDVNELRFRLPGRDVFHFDSLPTTMLEAASLARQGYRPGTLVVADEQTAGQGRHGHLWHSEHGAGVYMSIVLEPDPALTLALGLAVAEAIPLVCPLACDLRWPNDVLVGEKKVAGILVQSYGEVAVAGIGVNVNHRAFPPQLAHTATSLKIETGREYSRQDLVIEIARSVDTYCRILKVRGKAEIFEIFTRFSTYVTGKRVQVEQEGRIFRGVTAGLDASGFLLVRREDGSLVTVIAGGVRPLNSAI